MKQLKDLTDDEIEKLQFKISGYCREIRDLETENKKLRDALFLAKRIISGDKEQYGLEDMLDSYYNFCLNDELAEFDEFVTKLKGESE